MLFHRICDIVNLKEATHERRQRSDIKNGIINENGILIYCKNDALYRFSVGSYSSLINSDMSDLQRSGAHVTLYKGDSVAGEYTISPDSQGNAWCVLEIKDSQIKVVDSTYFINAMIEVD